MKRCRSALCVALSLFVLFAGLVPLMSIAAEDQQTEPGPKDKDASEEFTTTQSGLKYRILRKSDKVKPKATDTVKVHYKGWLDDETVFDSSYDRAKPTAFPLNRVIAGWTEGLQLVGEGGMIELEIPSELAYGERGRPPVIPPKATLHFITEVLEIQRPLEPGAVDTDAPEEFTETKSGLKYRIRRKGNGIKPKATTEVEVHYKGWLDGEKVFESSYDRRQSAEISLESVIPGWVEGIQLIGKGGMIELDIPAKLAFGEEGRPPVIPAKSRVHFIIELLEVYEPIKPGPVDKNAPEEFQTTESGLKYRIRRASDGKKPAATSFVKVHYKGWLDGGKVFDSSYEGGKPFKSPLNRVIPGWTEGMQLIGEQGMIELEIPYDLAYGEEGSPPTIPPKATLHFIIELLEVK